MNTIQQQLFALQDTKYKEFQSHLVPTIDRDKIIGVRIPVMRRLAKQLASTPSIREFLNDIPHFYYDENILHGLILCEEKDFAKAVEQINQWLPYVDNWAVCDLIRPKAFRLAAKTQANQLLTHIRCQIDSERPYTIRFGIEMLMTFFLDDKKEKATISSAFFRKEYLDIVANVTHEDYYVRMMVAWFFATALAKQYETTLPYLQQQILPIWTHNKTIQKAIESLRLTPQQKTYLKTLRV